MTKAFVLLSGGIDSSTALAVAIRDHGHDAVTAISIDYGQRHSRELTAGRNVCHALDVAREVHEMPGFPKSMLTDEHAAIPNMSYADITGVSPTYVPFRNGQLLSKIAAIAASRVSQPNEVGGETAEIYFGAHAEDAAGDAYPDCRLDFVGAIGAAIYIGTYHKVRLRAPLIEMRKDEIVLLGRGLAVPYGLTWSCYAGEDLHCGVCPTCRARKDGFAKAGIFDPTIYKA